MHHLATRRIPRIVPVVVLAALLLVPLRAAAAPATDVTATDTVRRHFETVLALLKAPSFRGLSHEGRREALRKVSDRIFGWEEMARRSLGAEWGQRVAREQRSFTEGFVRLVERFYLGRLEEIDVSNVSEVPIRYLGETAAARETVVRTRLVHRRDMPVNFWMVHRANRWHVVDVEVDGVSVVDNYRAQFLRVMTRDGYPALVERIADRTSAPREDRDLGASP